MFLLSWIFFLAALYSTTSGQLIPVTTNSIFLPTSIKLAPGYITLPACIKTCVRNLAIQLGCEHHPINGCFCNGTEASFAFQFLPSCVSLTCSTTPTPTNIDAGISVYTSYCSQALGESYAPNATPEPAPAEGNDARTSRPTSSGPKETGEAHPADELGKSEDYGKIAGLSEGAFIGVVLSCSCAVIGLLFGIGFKVFYKYTN